MRTTLRDLFPASRRSGSDDATLNESTSISQTYNANSTSASSTNEVSEKGEKGRPEPSRRKTQGDGRRELTRDDCEEETGYRFSTAKKWVRTLPF